MRIALTGVPGTGKSTIAYALSKMGFEVISINEVVEKRKLWRGVDEFGSRIVNLRKVEREINGMMRGKRSCVVEGHLACEMKLKCDVVIVCRVKPSLLKRRLRGRGYPERKVNENVMCELLDYCTILSLRNYRNVYEIRSDDADRGVEDIKRIIKGRGERLRVGWVRWRRELKRAATKVSNSEV